MPRAALRVISAHLPYDAAHYTAADAVVIAYGARGMSEDPRDKESGVSQYGPNVPAALYLILSGKEMTGKLPISIPKLDENGRFTDEPSVCATCTRSPPSISRPSARNWLPLSSRTVAEAQ